jgi:hypothetical protein
MKKVKPTTRHAAPRQMPRAADRATGRELVDAHSMAEERERKDDQGEAARQIGKFRIAMEDLASFERARSATGALFQMALACDIARRLFEEIPTERRTLPVDNSHDMLVRLLESVSLLLREKATPEEFLPLRGVIRFYLDVDGDYLVRPFQWRDDIPELAKRVPIEQGRAGRGLIGKRHEADGPARRLFLYGVRQTALDSVNAALLPRKLIVPVDLACKSGPAERDISQYAGLILCRR